MLILKKARTPRADTTGTYRTCTSVMRLIVLPLDVFLGNREVYQSTSPPRKGKEVKQYITGFRLSGLLESAAKILHS